MHLLKMTAIYNYCKSLKILPYRKSSCCIGAACKVSIYLHFNELHEGEQRCCTFRFNSLFLTSIVTLEKCKHQGLRTPCNSRCSIKCVLMSSAFHWLLNYTSMAYAPSFQHSNCLAPTNRYIKKESCYKYERRHHSYMRLCLCSYFFKSS